MDRFVTEKKVAGRSPNRPDVIDSPRLYAILDVEIATARGLAPLSVVEAWLSAGVRLIQLRAKTLPTGAMVALADQVAACCRQSGARFIVNDRVDVALMTGADGVHVGQTDVPPRRARAMMPPPRWIGYSTHSLRPGRAGRTRAGRLPGVRPRLSHREQIGRPDPLVGLDGLARAAARASDAALPLVAIGGITLDRVPEIVACGRVGRGGDFGFADGRVRLASAPVPGRARTD